MLFIDIHLKNHTWFRKKVLTVLMLLAKYLLEKAAEIDVYKTKCKADCDQC